VLYKHNKQKHTARMHYRHSSCWNLSKYGHHSKFDLQNCIISQMYGRI